MSLVRCALVFALLLTSTILNAEEEGFRPLFNGKNLDGWVPVNTAPSTWSVKDNMLICSGKPIGELRTDRMYQNFILEVEWRHMVPKGNAGIFVWGDDITAKGVPFHRSIEVQVLENAYGNTRGYTTHGDIFPIHGAKMTPINGRGGSRAFPTENRSKPSPEWNHYRIVCQDGTISLAVNGKVVTRGKDCNPRKGYICIESEGGIVHYRNMRIKELPSTPLDPSMVAIANRGYTTLYTGVDLSGWKVANDSGWTSNDWILNYKPNKGDHRLTTETEYNNFGFVFDVKRSKDSKRTGIHMRHSRHPVLVLDNDAGPFAKLLSKPGAWDRIEGKIVNDRLSVSVNGKLAIENQSLNFLPKSGPISIVPDGSIQFANLFVRTLSK